MRERDAALKRLDATSMLGAAKSIGRRRELPKLLGIELSSTEVEVQRRLRLLMRLLHPDRSINLPLRGKPEGGRVEAAFKALGQFLS